MARNGSGYQRFTGRPPKIDAVLGHDDNGNPITVADRILQQLRIGSYLTECAAAGGIDRTTLHEWMRTGADTLRRLHDGAPRAEFTRRQLRLAKFSADCAQAEAQALATSEALSARIERGGAQRTVQTTVTGICPKCSGQGDVSARDKDDPDKRTRCGLCSGRGQAVLRRTERTETTLPDAAHLRWRLSHRYPHLYGDQVTVKLGEADDVSDLLRSTEALALFDSVMSLADEAEIFSEGVSAGLAASADQALSAPQSADPAPS